MIRKLALAAGLLFLSLVTLATLVALFAEPEDFDLDVAAWISERTGREVQILGSLKYEFFPWLGIRVSDLRIAQPEGFDAAPPFLSVKEARVRVRLIPLLMQREVKLDRVEIVRPNLLLQRKKDGHDNWSDLLELIDKKHNDPDAELSIHHGKRSLPVAPFSWQGITLSKGSVRLIDEKAGEHFTLESLELTAEKGTDFGYGISCRLTRAKSKMQIDLAMEGRAQVTFSPLNLVLQDATLAMETSMLLPKDLSLADDSRALPLRAGLTALLNADLGAGAIKLYDANLRIGGIRLSTTITGQNIFSANYGVQGNLTLKECAPSKDSPLASLCTYLENVAANTDFSLDAKLLRLANLNIIMAGGDLTGQASFSFDKAPSVTATLASDNLDLNALFPEAPHEADGGSDTEEKGLPQWMVAWPEDFPHISLNFAAGRVKTGDFLLQNAVFSVISAPGELHTTLEKAGFLDGKMAVSCSSKQGATYCETSLQGVDGNALSDLLFGAEHMQGQLTLEAKASFNGRTANDMWKSLRLQSDITLSDGALDFTSPPKVLRTARTDANAPMPNFFFKNCDMSVAFSNANPKAAAKKMPFAYSVDATFTHLATQGLFGKPLPPRYGAPRPEYNGDVSGKMTLRGMAVMDTLQPMLLRMDRTDATVDYNGPGTSLWPRQRWHFKGKSKGLLDLEKDVLAFTNIEGNLPSLPVLGELIISDVFYPGPPTRYKGRIDLSPFPPGKVLPFFDVNLPETRDPESFGQAYLHAAYAIDNKRMDIDVERLGLDATTAGGSISIQELDKDVPSLHIVKLHADTLDLDGYLAPEEETPAAASGKTAPKEKAGSWKNDWLRHLRLQGTVSIGDFELYDLKYNDLRADFNASEGLLTLKPVTAGFYGGQFFGVLDVRTPDRPIGLGLSCQVNIADFNLESVVNKLGGEDLVGGTANWNMNLAGGGDSWKNFVRNLGGKVDFIVKDGFYSFSNKSKKNDAQKPSNMPGQYDRMQPQKAGGGKARTPFSRASASFRITDGQIKNDDFKVQGLIFKAQGSGSASLPAKTLDYTILVQMTGAPTIPVHLTGSFKNPDMTIWEHEMLTDSVGRLGGSVFNVFKSILTMPIKAIESLQN